MPRNKIAPLLYSSGICRISPQDIYWSRVISASLLGLASIPSFPCFFLKIFNLARVQENFSSRIEFSTASEGIIISLEIKDVRVWLVPSRYRLILPSTKSGTGTSMMATCTEYRSCTVLKDKFSYSHKPKFSKVILVFKEILKQIKRSVVHSKLK